MTIDLRDFDQYEHGKTLDEKLIEPDNDTPEADIARAWNAKRREARDKLEREQRKGAHNA